MEANKATKVTKVESYKDSQGLHSVVKGRLVFITKDEGQGLLITDGGKDESWCINPWKNIKKSDDCIIMNPIIISEIEEIEVGDLVYISNSNTIRKVNTNDTKDPSKWIVIGESNAILKSSCKKILALPEQLSPKHLQAIVDGKLKDGDEVYVECKQDLDEYYKPSHAYLPMTYFIKLTNNHIKLFPVKQEEITWSHIWIDWIKHNEQFKTDVSFSLWLQDNYNTPTKK